MFVDSKEQNWFKRDKVGIFLGREDIRTSLNCLEKYEMLTRQELVPVLGTTPDWSGSKDHQDKTDEFLSVFGVMYLIVNSRKDKGKALKEYILREIAPRGFDTRTEEIQEQHRQTITGHDNQIQAIQHENVAL